LRCGPRLAYARECFWLHKGPLHARGHRIQLHRSGSRAFYGERWGRWRRWAQYTNGRGGKLSCCVVMGRNTNTPFWINVEYQMDALETYSPRKEIEPAGPYINTRVRVDGPIPPDPEYLEIHFYQDHIEAAISGPSGPSPPRLKLQSRSDFAR